MGRLTRSPLGGHDQGATPRVYNKGARAPAKWEELIMSRVQLWWAIAGMSPTGTGSYSYWSNFRIVVENLSTAKVVGIWGRAASSGIWSFYPANFERSLGMNKEFWQARTTDVLDRFVVRYDVLGATYWDNNGGHDYLLDVAAAQSTDGVGTAILGQRVISQDNPSISGGRLTLGVSVQNLYFSKRVGVRFTTDHWATFHDAMAVYQQGYKPDLLPFQAQVESWYIDVPVSAPSTSSLEYAVYFDDHWDNDFGMNYGPIALAATAVKESRTPGDTAAHPARAWAGQSLKKEPVTTARERPIRAN